MNTENKNPRGDAVPLRVGAQMWAHPYKQVQEAARDVLGVSKRIIDAVHTLSIVIEEGV